MDYSQQMLARFEHDLMVKSLPSVSEYGYASRKQRPMSLLRTLLMSLLNFGIH